MNKEKKLLRDQEIESQYSLEGYIPSPEDSRDWKPEDVMEAEAPLPKTYRTEGKVGIMNQLSYSSCVAHALSAAMQYGEYKAGFKHTHDFSRGFIYANRRDTDWQGAGMITREALKQLNHCGDCMQETFAVLDNYKNTKKALEEKKDYYLSEALPYTITNYFRCETEEDVKKALINQGAVVVCVNIYPSFGGEAKAPQPGDKSKGGHAMCLVGWDETGWIIQNSWSSLWGNKGYCHLPYDYPVKEWWGITVDSSLPEPEVPNIFVRIFRKIKYFFSTIFRGIKNLFTK